ncbi:hypothetical protein JCM14076_21530 [Methylosoma difficile]
MSVSDQASAATLFGKTIASNEILFTFTNAVGNASNISEVYFDDDTTNHIFLSQTKIINSISGFTNFGSRLNPSNLPSGNSLANPFGATSGFGADVGNGGPSNGVNSNNDILGIVIKLKTGSAFNDVQSAFIHEKIRVGLHVRSIASEGCKDDSDSFVNDKPVDGGYPTPIPGAVWLFGSAFLAMMGVARKKQRLKTKLN